MTRFATVEGIRVIDKGEPHLFNLKAYLDTGDRTLLPAIGPGSTIFVPKEIEEVKGGVHTVYVMGEVFKPGSFEAAPKASFLDVLANAATGDRFGLPFGGKRLKAEVMAALEAVDGSEALVIATEWDEFANVDLAAVKKRMTTPIIFDGRNLLNPETMGELGFHYHSIGRASVLPR